MRQTVWLWIIALVVTLGSARYQRMTGPTWPLSGKAQLGATTIPYTLERTHGGAGDQPVVIEPGDPAITGIVEWKRYPTADRWKQVSMRREGERLVAELPHQPPAGKLAYRAVLRRALYQVLIPETGPVVTRFKGDVPPWILVPHVVFMFLAMLLSTRAGLECFSPRPSFRRLTWWTLGTLIVGGFVFGPLVLHHAFGEWWGGFPLGADLTDSKTLIALLGWLGAAIAVNRLKQPRAWVAFAALLMLVIFMIPHSLGGSELDYGKVEQPRTTAPATQR
jgi:hypothetical protein